MKKVKIEMKIFANSLSVTNRLIRLIVILIIVNISNVNANTLSRKYDVLVAGAGTGGWATAVQAARMGCSVLLIDETDWIGGQMTAAGVTSMDEGMVIRQQGIYNEFYNSAVRKYKEMGKSVSTCYFNTNSIAVEPKIGQKILYDFIDKVNKEGLGHIEVLLRTKILKVYRHGNRVKGVDVMNTDQAGFHKKRINCTILVDATEYGDVIPLTGARYRIGKSTSDNIDLDARIQSNTWTAVIKEYPNGIPAHLQIKTPPPGFFDPRTQKEFYRIVANCDPNHKIGFGDLYAEKTPWLSVVGYRGMPDSSRKDSTAYPTRTHLNIYQNDMMMTVKDLVNPTKRWKKEIEMRMLTLQLLYYVQQELKLPWSVANDEGYDSPYNLSQISNIISDYPSLKPFESVLQFFPPIPYVRESRRMIGLHTVVADEISRFKGPKFFKDAISVNDYSEDLHGSKSQDDMELSLEKAPDIEKENLPWDIRAQPFQLPFGAFIPELIDGFLCAEKNISQSRLVNGATRLQPSTMINGQAVGIIAALAIKNKIQPRLVDFVQVQKAMLDAGVQLVFAKDIVPRNSPDWKNDQLKRLNESEQ